MRRVTLILSGIAVAGMLLADPAAVSAFDCETNPQCTPPEDGAGCCDPSTCTLRTSGDCRDEDIYENSSCRKGTCNGAGQCIPKPDGSVYTSGKCIDHGNIVSGVEQVSATTNPCTIGTCGSGGVCNTPSNSEPRCLDDGNVCTTSCTLSDNPTGNRVYVCDNDPLVPNDTDCFSGTVTACSKGRCLNGVCDTSASSPVDCSSVITNVPECRRLECAGGTPSGCQVVPTPRESCDTNFADCIGRVCSTNATSPTCLSRNERKGRACAPGDGNGCTNDYCNGSGSCSTSIALPDDPPVDCIGPHDCRRFKCYGGTCTGFENQNEGAACSTDGNPCTDQWCQSGGCAVRNCDPDPSPGPTACNNCSTPGTCVVSGTTCICSPN